MQGEVERYNNDKARFRVARAQYLRGEIDQAKFLEVQAVFIRRTAELLAVTIETLRRAGEHVAAEHAENALNELDQTGER